VFVAVGFLVPHGWLIFASVRGSQPFSQVHHCSWRQLNTNTAAAVGGA
jgi:hypothetical protein